MSWGSEEEWEDAKANFNYQGVKPVPTPQYILTKNSLTILADGQVNTIDNSHAKWDHILQLIKDKEWDEVILLIQIRDRIAEFIADHNSITIQNDEVLFNGEILHNSLCGRLVDMYHEGFDIEPMLNFLSNMMQNPSYTAIEGLYRFLENNKLPITSDGYFLAYKRIKDNWTDCHTGAIDNSVNKTVSMPRNQVEDNPDISCSKGLHVCSLSFLTNFGGTRLIACKIHPKDVVSVPKDYNDSKMRVCRYEVIQELDMKLVGGRDEAWDNTVVDTEEEEKVGFEEEDTFGL